MKNQRKIPATNKAIVNPPCRSVPVEVIFSYSKKVTGRKHRNSNLSNCHALCWPREK